MTIKYTHMMAILAMLLVTVLVGCSKNESSEVITDPLAIRLNAGMQITSKAAVNNGTIFTASIAGWESSLAVNYGVKRSWQTTSAIAASETAAGVTLAEPQHYSQNSAVKTYIKAWYPAGTLSDDGVVSFGGAADGTVDVLLADEVSGSANDATNKTLAFSHPLTQVKFAVQGDADFGTTTKVKSITIKDAGMPTGVDLNTNTVSYTTTDLKVPEIDGTQSITETKTIIGQPTMIRPITGSTFNIDIETTVATYRNVVVTVTDANLKAGKAYTITLSFASSGIIIKAIVTAWDDTGVGSGDITTD